MAKIIIIDDIKVKPATYFYGIQIAKMMKRTIIYVFGPLHLFKNYVSNQELKIENGGWLKIGQTTTEDDNADAWDVAMKRISREVRTGIPVPCRIFDIFEYPSKSSKIDDKIRKILAEDVYQLETSMHHNRNLISENYEVKAGREFVYGVKRSQVLNAIAKYERDLILEHYGKKDFDKVVKMLKKNIVEAPFETSPISIKTNAGIMQAQIVQQNDELWNKIVDRLKTENDISNISNPAGRPYLSIKSPTHEMSYVLSFSVRYDLAYVAFETFKGETGRDGINQIISGNSTLSQIAFIKKQGAKNKKKWAWLIADTLDKPIEELIEWYICKFCSLYNEFEKQ